MGMLKILSFIVYLLFGLWMLLFPFGILSFGDFGNWMVMIGGILMIIAGIIILKGKSDGSASAVAPPATPGVRSVAPRAQSAVQKQVAAVA